VRRRIDDRHELAVRRQLDHFRLGALAKNVQPCAREGRRRRLLIDLTGWWGNAESASVAARGKATLVGR
jgi:hypothetical protein